MGLRQLKKLLAQLYAANSDDCYKVRQMLSDKNSLPADMDAELARSQKSLGLALSEKQAEAVRMWAKSP